MRRLILAKAGRDVTWTLIIVLILTVGLTAWILIPSVSDSLQNGLEEYADHISTYMFIQSNNGPALGNNSPLLQNLIPKIEHLQGVQFVYPIKENFTYHIIRSYICLPNGKCGNATITEAIPSAVIGGKNGFPIALVDLVKGHLPQDDEPAFVWNAACVGQAIKLNETFQLKIGSSDWNSTRGVKFNAMVAGETAINPLTSQVEILWNRAFLQNKLGSLLYNSTFGGLPNLLIIKADGINDVKGIANAISGMLETNPNFSLVYDQATLLALQELESQSLPLYELLSGSSLVATVVVVFAVTYLGAARRKWEPGLLVTQGWTWRRYSRFMLFYYFVLAMAASAFSAVLSLIIEHLLLYQFAVSGNVLTIAVTLSPFYLISVAPLSLLVSCAASLVSTSQIRRAGLDSILRDY